jgi:predicted lipoprotein with Yx(FWY)xxD motif
LFTRDSSQKSRCYGGCASVWPPYLTAGQPTVTGVPASLLGTTRRSNGARQVTYAGHPLYHYTGDRKPGDVLCQAVSEFGGGWYVVSPSGSAIR